MRTAPGRVRSLSIAVTGVALCAAPALAQLREGDALGPVVANLPMRVKFVAVSPNPQGVLKQVQTQWRRLGPVAMGLGSDTLKQWAHLSQRLGYGPEDAFAALTSGGVAVVIADPAVTVERQKGEDEGGNPGLTASVDGDWAVVSIVKPEVAARVRERLEAAPLEVVGGRPVLSVEHGRFALVCRALTDAPGSDEVLALLPVASRALLGEVVQAVEAARARAPVDPDAPLVGSTRAFRAAAQVRSDLAALIAGEGQGDAPAERWGHATVASCRFAADRWAVEAQTFVGADASATGLPDEAAAWFDAWSPQAVAMIAAGTGTDLSKLLTAAEPSALRPGESVDAVAVYAGAPPHGPAGVWCAACLTGGDAASTATLDAWGDRLVEALERGDWPDVIGGAKRKPGRRQAEGPGFSVRAAMPAGALRVSTVQLPGTPSLRPGSQGEDSTTPGSIAWFQCTAPRAANEAARRWLVWSVQPTQEGGALTARHREVSSLLTGPAQPGRAWLVRAVVRPAGAVDVLPGPLSVAASVAGLGAIGEVRLEAWRDRQQGAELHTRLAVDWTQPQSR